MIKIPRLIFMVQLVFQASAHALSAASLPSLEIPPLLASSRFLAAARDCNSETPDITPLENTPLTCLFNETGAWLGIQSGDSITVSAQNTSTGVTELLAFSVENAMTLDNFRDRITDVLNLIDGGISVNINANGTLTVNTMAALIDAADLIISSNNPQSDSLIKSAFWWPSALPVGASYNTAGAVRRPADALDELADVYDAHGNPLGLESGDEIRVDGSVGAHPVAAGTHIYSAGYTMQELLDLIRQTLRLPDTDGSADNLPTVGILACGESDTLPAGAIIIRGLAGCDFKLTDISVTAINMNGNNTSPQNFHDNAVFVPIQAPDCIAIANADLQHSTAHTKALIRLQSISGRTAQIQCSIPLESLVRMDIFLLSGKRLHTFESNMPAGSSCISFPIALSGTGIYLSRISINNKPAQSARFMLK